jgi:large subunit ribosomal protein L22
MEVRAVAKYVKIQPRKVRIIADEVRGMDAIMATHKLRYHTSKSAAALRKVLVSAMANAAENHELEPTSLKIAEIRVDEGPRQKRMRARAMGRGNRIVKKTAHITVVVADHEAAEAVKPHGTRPKARPTLAVKPGRAPKGTTPTSIATPSPAVSFAPAPVQEENANTTEETTVANDAIVAEGGDATSTADDAVAPAEPTTNEAVDADQAKQEEQS